MNGTPNSASTRRTSSGGTIAPPENAMRRLDRFRGARAAAASSAVSIVGTPPMTVPRYLSVSSSARPGSKRAMTTWVPSVWTSPRVISPHPATWKYGIGLTRTSPARRPMASAASRALLVRPRWVSTAALGRPVVPEVYRICAGLAGSTSGSVLFGWEPPSPAGHSPSVITCRSARISA